MVLSHAFRRLLGIAVFWGNASAFALSDLFLSASSTSLAVDFSAMPKDVSAVERGVPQDACLILRCATSKIYCCKLVETEACLIS